MADSLPGRLDPAVAAVRRAVRSVLGDPPGLVLVACSGGADSLALAAATAFVAPRAGWRAGLVTVDHQLQGGSATQADSVADWARSAGFDPVTLVTVNVGGGPFAGGPFVGGPEAAARDARYAALAAAAAQHAAATVLLGHTKDDQAETVLLALARGSGPRGLAGMPARFERSTVLFNRPFLDISRNTCREACAALGLTPWEDPHNADPAYTRSRVRHELLPSLVSALGPGVIGNLARSASLIAADTAYLDDLAEVALDTALIEGGLNIAVLAELAAPIRTRVLRAWVLSAGASPGALSHRHLAAIDALVTAYHGQGPAMLPGGISVRRSRHRLVSSRTAL